VDTGQLGFGVVTKPCHHLSVLSELLILGNVYHHGGDFALPRLSACKRLEKAAETTGFRRFVVLRTFGMLRMPYSLRNGVSPDVAQFYEAFLDFSHETRIIRCFAGSMHEFQMEYVTACGATTAGPPLK